MALVVAGVGFAYIYKVERTRDITNTAAFEKKIELPQKDSGLEFGRQAN